MEEHIEDNGDEYPNEMETELRVLRLITGEDLITECTEVEDNEGFGMILVNPLKILYFMNRDTGTITINFIRWFNSVIVEDQIFKLEAVNILTYQYPTPKLAEKYLEWVHNDDQKKEKGVIASTTLKHKKHVEEELKALDSLEKKINDINISKFVQKSLKKIGTKSVKKDPVNKRKPRATKNPPTVPKEDS